MLDITSCVDDIAGELHFLTKEEIHDYVSQVMTKAREFPNLRGVGAIKYAQDEIGDLLKKSAFDMVKVSENNLRKMINLENRVRGKTANIRELLVRRFKNLGNNVESHQRSAQNRLQSYMFDPLSTDDSAYLQDNSNKMQIADAFDNRWVEDIQAKRVANAIKVYSDKANSEMVNSNAMLLEHVQKDRMLKATHDVRKILQGNYSRLKDAIKSVIKNQPIDHDLAFDQWADYITPRLNVDHTFADTHAIDEDGNVNDEAVRNILRSVFDNIVSGKRDVFMNTALLQDVKDLRAKKSMFFHWKDMRSWMEYSDKYGTSNLMDAIMADIHSRGNRIGMAEMFGMFPDQAYEALSRIQKEEGEPHSNLWYWRTNNMFKEVNGDTKIAVSPTLASWGSNLRAFSSMARLPGLVLQSLTDTNIAASYASRFHINYGKAFIKQFEGVVSQWSDKDLKQFSQMMHLNLQHQIGYMGKFADAQNLGQITSKITSAYYRMIGMIAWDNGNRAGLMATIARKLADEGNKSFDNLNASLKSQLVNHNITSDEWEALKGKTRNRLFSLDNVENLSADELKGLWKKSSSNVSLSQYQSDLYAKVFSLFDHAADNAILTPGAYTRSLLNLGTRPGTITGEAVRMIMQFKGFPLTYIDRTLVGGWKNADGAQGKFLWALHNFGSILPLSYLSTYLYNLGQGKTTVWNKDTLLQVATPAFGVLGQLFDSTAQNSTLLPALFTTPSLRLISNALDIPLGLATLNPDNSLKAARKVAQYGIPFANTPFASPWIRGMLGEKPYLQPGQQTLFGPS